MVGPHHASVALWFTISTIIDQRRERDARNTSPVVVRDEIEILIPNLLAIAPRLHGILTNHGVPFEQTSKSGRGG